MARKPFFRQGLRATQRQNVNYIEKMAGREIPELRSLIKAPAAPRAPRDEANSEAPVIRAVGELLAVSPDVLFAVRQNSGALPYANAEGRAVPVWFYRVVTRDKMRISDYWGVLANYKLFAIECKRPSWTKPTDQREKEQAQFLEFVRSCGGVAGFARSVDEALALITAQA